VWYRGFSLAAAFSLFALSSVNAGETGPVLFEPGLVSTGFDDSHAAFAPDGQMLYFLRNTPDFMHWTVLMSPRVGNGWAEPVIAPFSGRWSDADVFITRDNKRLYFVSTRPVDGQARGDTDLWVMTREGENWGAPNHIPQLSSTGYEWFPTLTDSGTIYFGSEREGGLGLSDIWRAHWAGDHFSPPENLGPTINSADEEIEPLISPDERWLIFAARGHKPSAGKYDLYITYNCPSGWTNPRELGAGVNSSAWDFAPRISPDGRRFFFTSNRANTEAPFTGVHTLADLERRLHSPGNGLRDIYSVDTGALGIQPHCRK
jgi:dipeptidyl aminopeptidase/acylaminoacyl peptidase